MTPDKIHTLLEVSKFKVQRWIFENTPVGLVERDIVVHPGAVLILPILSDSEIIMIHNMRHAVGRELFELPAGTLETDEPPEACARRELEEETGYRAGIMEPLCEFYTRPGICTELMHTFVARDLTKTKQDLDGTEQIRVEIIPLERAVQLIASGQMADGKSIAAISTYYLRQRNS